MKKIKNYLWSYDTGRIVEAIELHQNETQNNKKFKNLKKPKHQYDKKVSNNTWWANNG